MHQRKKKNIHEHNYGYDRFYSYINFEWDFISSMIVDEYNTIETEHKIQLYITFGI